MKRSEMLKLLRKELIDWTCIDHHSTKEEMDEIVEMLLIRIEDAGMLPPCTGYKNKHKENISYYEWEPEDEV